MTAKTKYTFDVGTKVWPVLRNPASPKNVWCARPVHLNRVVQIGRDAISVTHNKAMRRKFSRFVQANEKGKKYAVFLFDQPVPQHTNVVVGFISRIPVRK